MERESRRRLAGGALALALAAGCGGGGSAGPVPPQPGETCTLASREVRNEGWDHVSIGAAVTYASNPPASGPHYPEWARYRIHTTAVPRPYWVHNLEHGAIVFLYRPGASANVVTTLTDTYRALPADPACGHTRSLLTPDPELRTAVAVVAANRVLEGECVDPRAVLDFAVQFRGRGPEPVCAEGGFP